MRRPTELDLAALKHEFREMYKNLGFVECCQVLYEILVSAEVLSEVMMEEHREEEKDL